MHSTHSVQMSKTSAGKSASGWSQIEPDHLPLKRPSDGRARRWPTTVKRALMWADALAECASTFCETRR